MPDVTEVEISAADPQRFASVLDDEQMAALRAAIDEARRVFDGRTIWNVNSTAKGGGVAEMLAALLPYARGAGVGVVEGFVEGVAGTCEAHLLLAGPSVDEVADDPEGAETYQEVGSRHLAQYVEVCAELV